jgi:hypothetical protein
LGLCIRSPVFVSVKNKDCDPFGIFSSPIGARGPEYREMAKGRGAPDRLISRLVGKILEFFYTLLVDKLDDIGCSGLS